MQSVDIYIASGYFHSMMKCPERSLNWIFARNLKRLRGKLSLSQEELAETCGLHRTYIGAIERGERNITLDTLEKIAHTLGINPASLLLEEVDLV